MGTEYAWGGDNNFEFIEDYRGFQIKRKQHHFFAFKKKVFSSSEITVDGPKLHGLSASDLRNKIDLHNIWKRSVRARIRSWSLSRKFNASKIYDQSNLLEAIKGEIPIRPCGGSARGVYGEDLNRLVYNRSYLARLANFTEFKNKDILEIGCSDGLLMSILMGSQPRSITGQDLIDVHDCFQSNDICKFLVGSNFLDQDFTNHYDVIISIATLEHVIDPFETMMKALRLLRPGGIAYFQAGPLYFAKTGHHMFSELESFPWGHLIYSPEDLASLISQKGLRQIEIDFGMSAISFIEGMLSRDHLNHLTLEEYQLERVSNTLGYEVLFYEISKEGTESELKEIFPYIEIDVELYLTHGFELVIRKVL
jgi:SAM-dependent methyltransferase